MVSEALCEPSGFSRSNRQLGFARSVAGVVGDMDSWDFWEVEVDVAGGNSAFSSFEERMRAVVKCLMWILYKIGWHFSGRNR